MDIDKEFEAAWPAIHKRGLDHGWKGIAKAAWRAALASQDTAPPAEVPAPEGEPTAWVLNDRDINSIQAKSIQQAIDRCRHAHFTNLVIRINGKNEYHEADWVKYLARAAAPAQAVDALTRYALHEYVNGAKMVSTGPTQGEGDGEFVRYADLRAALAAQPAAPCRACALREKWADQIFAAPVANAGQKVASSGGKVASEHATLDGQALTREQVWTAFSSIPDIPDGLYAQVQYFLKNCKAPSGQAQAVAGPDGWRLVPVEPTQEMLAVFAQYDLFDCVREVPNAINVIASAMWKYVCAAAPLPQQVAQPFPTSRDAYEKMTPERKAALDADLKVLEQRIESHRRSRDRRTHDEPVAEERRHGDRRHAERRDSED